MIYKELGQKAYFEWAKVEEYTATKKQLLEATKDQLEQFHDSFIMTRLRNTDESLEDCEEAFWDMLGDIGVATEINL